MTRVTIDGSQGEGGGQMLRSGLSLSALRGRPLEMVNIRASRPKPGLARQHLMCVQAAAAVCGARVTGAEIGSRHLVFEPGEIRGGDFRFDIGSAGSVTLVAQTVLPVLLRAPGGSSVTIRGGTHVPFAPPWEFFAETYLPQLRRMGAEVEAELVAPGFYPAGGGEIRLRVKPFAAPRRYGLTDLGAYRGGTAVAVVSNLSRSLAQVEAEEVVNFLPDLNLEMDVCEMRSPGPGNICQVRLVYDNLTLVFSEVGTKRRSREETVDALVDQVERFLDSGEVLEEYVSDQLQLPLAEFLPEDHDVLWPRATNQSLHFRTNAEVLGLFR